MPGPGTLTIGVAMSRERRGFSQRDRLLLELLRPHLAHGRARAAHEQQLRQARAALEAAAAGQHRAVVVLTRGGRIAWTTPPARQLLREWFGYDGGVTLPEQLASWIAAPDASPRSIAPARTARCLRLARGGRTLTATLLAALTLDGELLLTFDQHALPHLEQLARLALTRREGEVLTAAAHGVGEQAIARKLAISRRTVNKHLEHTYRKLNVTNRAQAIAAAFRSS
jgi:DNA-binding CsgD family transcriptional regulator